MVSTLKLQCWDAGKWQPTPVAKQQKQVQAHMLFTHAVHDAGQVSQDQDQGIMLLSSFCKRRSFAEDSSAPCCWSGKIRGAAMADGVASFHMCDGLEKSHAGSRCTNVHHLCTAS
mmetsp:Transcript_13181/g.38340  ORF Transcript_13181/g.38340 Transcript_13181/m.38340 type:complete len:115 (-) Transcript_13181:32-376(-)|eukprot:351309-Chlamydomonas_euryale.AAC.5